jgi:Escherichia/Staphylococcus phage prohead protease
MNELPMSLRSVDPETRLITGVVAPYDAVSYLAGDPAGERVIRGAFTKSIKERGGKIPLCVAHNHAAPIGISRSWNDDDDGLTGVFYVKPGDRGDEALYDAREGILSDMSVGFHALPGRQTRDAEGVLEIREAKLGEVSLVIYGAYTGARVLAVRSAQDLDQLLAPFQNRPDVNLSPIAAVWRYDQRR